MLFALDEVANIAPLPGLPAILAEGGSQGLVVLACLQDLSQARARWDRAADGFLTLFTHKVVLPGIADRTTLQAVSDLAGQVDVPVRSVSTAAPGCVRAAPPGPPASSPACLLTGWPPDRPGPPC